MTNMYNKEEAGRSMVEMLGVLAIVGVLSIGGISGYSKAMAKYKVNKTLDQVSMLVTNIRTTYGNQSAYTGLTPSALISYELVDREMYHSSTSKLVNPYNGNVTVAAAGTGDVSFTVTYEGLPREACASIASSNWGDSAASGLVSMQINDSDEHTWTTSGTYALPIPFSTAGTECSGTGNANKIKWTYY